MSSSSIATVILIFLIISLRTEFSKKRPKKQKNCLQKWGKNIQAAAYSDARTKYHLWGAQILLNSFKFIQDISELK